MAIEKRVFDAIIIGAGGAGLRAALQLTNANLSIAVLSKVFPTRSHTVSAQGGIAASLGNVQEDCWQWHMYDTVKGSDWLGDQDAIEFLCRKANEAVIELERFGMPFDRLPNGKIYQRPFGGHTAEKGKRPMERACAVADRAGHAMLHTLYQRAVRDKVQFFVEWVALDLIRDEEGDVVGVVALEIETGKLVIFHAKAVLLAAGGGAQVYAESTNALISTGDGLGMAVRAGIPLQDMEFWQFHPTGLPKLGILITEGARGEGGILFNSKGERYMERYAPTVKELASRDVISRASAIEIHEGRGCGKNKDYVLLQLTHLGAEKIMNKLPGIRDIAMEFMHIDPIHESIPVVPTAHYMMGGVPANYHGEVVVFDQKSAVEVKVSGLYAAGETACISVHGANRLGTNSLLDTVVFGKSAGDSMLDFVKSGSRKPLPHNAADKTLARLDRLEHQKDGERVSEVKKAMANTLQVHAAVFRTQAVLKEGVAKILAVEEQVKHTQIKDKSKVWNTARLEACELDNLIEIAKATLFAAAAREESRGAHTRDDFPKRDDVSWLKHSLFYSHNNSLSYKPVRLKPLTAETVEPKERVY